MHANDLYFLRIEEEAISAPTPTRPRPLKGDWLQRSLHGLRANRGSILWLTVALALIAALAWTQRDQVAGVAGVLTRVHGPAALFALGVLASVEFAKALRWQALYGKLRPRYLWVLQATVLGQVANALSPLRVGEPLGLLWAQPSASGLARGGVGLLLAKAVDALVLGGLIAWLVGSGLAGGAGTLLAGGVLVAAAAGAAILRSWGKRGFGPGREALSLPGGSIKEAVTPHPNLPPQGGKGQKFAASRGGEGVPPGPSLLQGLANKLAFPARLKEHPLTLPSPPSGARGTKNSPSPLTREGAEVRRVGPILPFPHQGGRNRTSSLGRILASGHRFLAAGAGYARELDLRVWGVVLGTTAFAWIAGGAANAVVLMAVGAEANADLAARVLASGYLAGLVPGPPAKLGVFEAAVAGALISGGTPTDLALAAAVLLHALQLAKLALLALVSAELRGKSAE